MTARHEIPPSGKPALLATRIADEVPQLATERLTLRAPKVADFTTYAEVMSGPRGVATQAPSRAEVWLDFCNYVAGWILHGHGIWTVVAKGSETVLGFVMIGLEPGDQAPELGYVFTEEAGGKGYATEAAREARSYALGALRLPSLVSYIRDDNAPSIALAERLGARRDIAAEAALGEDSVRVYRHEERPAQ